MTTRLSSALLMPCLLGAFCLLVSGVRAAQVAVAGAGVPEPVKPMNASQLPTKFHCIVCDDIKDKTCEPWDHFTHSVDCLSDPRIDRNKSIGCRKMVQTIGDKTYVSRQCTNLVDGVQGCIDRVGTKKIKVVYCHCNKPNCNAAPPVTSTCSWALHLTLLGALAAALGAR